MWSETWTKRNQNVHAGQASLESCYYRVMSVATSLLTARLDDNRRLKDFLLHYQDALETGWVQSWLEEFDFFFMDCWDALEMDKFYRDEPARRPDLRLWPQIYPGGREEHGQAWAKLKARRDAEVQRNNGQDRPEETPVLHELAAR
jgi:hypothetical protein